MKETYVISYGARAPIEGRQEVLDQLYLRHRYENKLREIELARRKAVHETMTKYYPRQLELEEALSALGEAAEEKPLTPEQKASRKAWAAELKALKAKSFEEAKVCDVVLVERFPKFAAAMTEVKRLLDAGSSTSHAYGNAKSIARSRLEEILQSDEFKSLDESLRFAVLAKKGIEDAEYNDAVAKKAARAESGVYWGTYTAVERGCQSLRRGRPPRFRRFDGRGVLEVVPRSGSRCMTGKEIKDGKSNVIRIKEQRLCDFMPRPENAHPDWGAKATHRVATMRVGIENEMALIPFVQHRPLPDEARVANVQLVKNRCGPHETWSLNFTVECERSRPVGQGLVAVSFGWRKTANGDLIIATIKDDAGRVDQVVLPKRIEKNGELRQGMDLNDHVEHLQSERDNAFNAARDRLAAFLKSVELSEEWKARAGTIAAWRSSERLYRLVPWWEANRLPGDDEILAHIAAWRSFEERAWTIADRTRQRFIRWRREIHRVFAAQLRERYEFVVVDNTNYTTIKNTIPEVQRQMRLAAAGDFRATVIKAFGSDRVITVESKGISSTCSKCGAKGDKEIGNVFVCKCGCTDEYNTLVNMLGLAAKEAALAND